MLESDEGLSVSLTRQCCGMGSGRGGAAVAAGGAPRPAPGAGGGTNTPAGTVSTAVTVACGVERVRRLSQVAGVDAPARSMSVNVSMASSLGLQGFGALQ